MKADLARGVHVDVTSKTTVAEYFARWIDVRVIRDGTRLMYLTMLRNHLEPVPLGSRPLVKVKPSEIQAWVRDRSRVLKPGTLRRHTGVLRSVFATAEQDGLIARNPVQPGRRLSMPREPMVKVVPLTVEQVQAWADRADPRIKAMITTQAGLGPRIGELKALRLETVDFMRREVHIGDQIDVRTGAPRKTHNGVRTVPLPRQTAEALAEHIRRYGTGPDGLIFCQTPKLACKPRGRSVPGETRTRMAPGVWSPAGLWRLYHDSAVAAGLPDGTSSHALRHHYVSVLIAAGANVVTVAERIGDRPEEVWRTYAHLWPGQEDTTRRAIEEAWDKAADEAGDKAADEDGGTSSR